MKRPSWFRPRGYPHFDAPIGVEWALANAVEPTFVSQHSWSPLIHRIKETKRYKPKDHKTVSKKRDIMFASHRDACILARYSADLVERLDTWYKEVGLDDTAIAYRSLGKSNYHFAAVVQEFVRAHDPVTILCFDVSGFFDNINHARLKRRLKWLLKVDDLPDDWFKVFRSITKFRRVEQEDLKANSVFAARMATKKVRAPVATLQELNAAGITIHKNPNAFGIPQGTPISASMSNLYMVELDQKLKAEAEKRGALYQRYSDDMLVACHPNQAAELEAVVMAAVADEALEIQEAKTDRCHLEGDERETFQYLGYNMGYVDAKVRPGSMSKQWRSAKRAVRKAEREGKARIDNGEADKIYTRKLRGKLTHVGVRNFIAYFGRSADELGSKPMKAQAKKLHRFAFQSIDRIKGHKP